MKKAKKKKAPFKNSKTTRITMKKKPLGRVLNDHAYKLLGYKFGGDIANMFDGLDNPALSQGLQTLTTTVDTIKEMNADGRRARRNVTPKLAVDNNPYFKMGGTLPGFKGPAWMMEDEEIEELQHGGDLTKFKGPSHEQGGIAVDEDMERSPNPVAEVEGGETGHKGFIFSDSLGLDGKTFAELSEDVDEKYSKDDDLSKRGKNFELDVLKKQNEIVKQIADEGANQVMRFGGQLKKYALGGDPWDDVLKPLKTDLIGDKRFDYNPYSDEHELDDTYGMGTKTKSDFASNYINPINPVASGGSSASPTSPVGKKFNYDGIALGLKSLGLLKSGLDAMKRPEQDILRQNQARGEVASLAEGRSIDLTSLNTELELGKNAAIKVARNQANGTTAAALEQSAILGTARARSANKLKELDANNNYRLQEAQIKQALGTEDRAYQRETDVANMQNEATARGFGRDFFSNLTQVGSQFNKKQVIEDTIANNKELAQMAIREGFAILNAKNEFKLIDPDAYMAKLKEQGVNIDDLIRYGG